MAIPIGYTHVQTGETLYALLFDANRNMYNPSTEDFEAYSGTLGTYDIPLTEGDILYYETTLTRNFATGAYTVAVFRQAGGSPATPDDLPLTVRTFAYSNELGREIDLKDIYGQTTEICEGTNLGDITDLLNRIYSSVRVRTRP